MNFYIARDGQSLGPYNEAQVRQYIKVGIFTPDVLGCREGEEAWYPLSELFPSQPSRMASTPKKIVSSGALALPRTAPAPVTQLPATTKAPSVLTIFGVAFLGVLLAGGLLLGAWYKFLRDKPALPLVVTQDRTSSARTTAQPAGGFFSSKGEIEGSVFVVTRGGQNYKLGAVQVSLYPEEELKKFVDARKATAETELQRLNPLVSDAREINDQAQTKKRAAFDKYLKAKYDDPERSKYNEDYRGYDREADGASARYDSLRQEQKSYFSGEFYFRGIPDAQVVTQTDADGKFTLNTPAGGKFVIVATAKRSVVDDTELYYWMVKESVEGGSKKTLLLTNNNMTSSGATSSMVATIY